MLSCLLGWLLEAVPIPTVSMPPAVLTVEQTEQEDESALADVFR